MTETSRYHRIHIIGGAGNGKTILARQLAEFLAFPCYHLDQIGWNENSKVPLAIRLEAITEIVAQPTLPKAPSCGGPKS